MKVTTTALEGVLLIEPTVHRDERGLFLESFRGEEYGALGIPRVFPQENLSRSGRGTVRGLHFQEPRAQGKLIQVIRGAVFDVVVDVRRGSPSFGRWIACTLDDVDYRQVWIPPGFAHGFCVTSDQADMLYKCTGTYAPEVERVIAWDDPTLGISWPVERPRLSPRDASAPRLSDAPELPCWPRV